ncbi:MAG: hypothetical protein ACJ73S_24230 [Mycobacteriales bacterium]
MAVGLGLAALLTAAACGHKADKADHKPAPAPAGAAGAIRAAYDKTAAMKSAKVDLSVKTTGRNATSTTGSGEIDFVNQAADLTLRGGLLDGVEVKLAGGTAYAKVPEMARSIIGNGKPWVKVNVSTVFGKNGSGSATENPTDVLKELNAVSDDVRKVGTEKIRGTQTTHYRAHLDPAKAATRNGGDAPSWLTDVKNATLDVWLDDKGAVRQVAEKNNNDTGTFAATVTLYDLGTKVSVSPPPADQVTDAGNLSSLLGGMHD